MLLRIVEKFDAGGGTFFVVFTQYNFAFLNFWRFVGTYFPPEFFY